ncbi:MAG: undecaprenyl-diphosphate phosphatase, partial [Nitriliruptoraceae bacterium]
MVPEWLQALILGLVQGATEFLPVSSSAHLVLVPTFFGWERPGLAFDVALHAGSALAVVVYYRRELWAMAVAVAGRGDAAVRSQQRRLVAYLGIATVPVGVAGLTLRGQIEGAFADPRIAATMLLVTAAVLAIGERVRAHRVRRAGDTSTPSDPGFDHDTADPTDPSGRGLTEIRLRDAFVIGFGQAFALLPGLSRSGATITAAVAGGLTRPAATRFAFLLALPAILGATLVSLSELTAVTGDGARVLSVGVSAAFLSGYVAIATFVRIVARKGLGGFIGYLVIASAVSWG